jgi:hypothetical protein
MKSRWITVAVALALVVVASGALPALKALAAGLFYSKSTATNFSILSDWGTNSDGSGMAPTVIDNTSDFIVANSAAITTLGGNINIRNLTINSGSSLTLDGANILTSSGTGGGTVTVAGSLTVAGSVASQLVCVNLTINNGGTITNNTNVGSGQPIAVSSTFTINNGGTYIHNTSRSANIGATKSFGNTSNFEYRNGGAFSTSLPYGNLRWNGTGSATADVSSTWTINGTLKISTGTFNLQSSNTGGVNIGGGFLVDGGTFNSSSGAGVGTITFVTSGVGSGDIQITSGSASFQNITINSNRTVGLLSNISIPSSRTFLVNGTLNAGTYVVSGAGNFTLASGATLGIGSSDGISASGATGNIQVTGTRNFNTGANYVYNGSSAQTTGTGLTGANNLTINNSGGVTLNADCQVNGVLALTSGDLDTSVNTLTMGSSATSSGDYDAVGNVKRTSFSADTAYSFGNSNVSLNFASGGTLPSDVTVNLAKTQPVTYAVDRTYTITPTGGSGFSATLRLRYKDSELHLANGATENNLYILKNISGSWVKQTRSAIDTTNNWVETSGVSSFSDWTISGNNPTTAITLLSFTAASPLPVAVPVLGLVALGGLAAVATLGISAGLVKRRRA